MDGYIVEQREVLVAITGQMGGSYVVIGEVSEQRALDPPLCIAGAMCWNGSEVGGYASAQSQGLLLSVELAAHEFELYLESLFVIYDFRLVGGHPYIGSIAIAQVVDEQ